MGEKKKKELKAVNPMLFLVAIILIVAVASYIVPPGSYDRVYDAVADREIVDPNSYHAVDRNPISLFTLLMSVTLGMQNAAYIIFFLSEVCLPSSTAPGPLITACPTWSGP